MPDKERETIKQHAKNYQEQADRDPLVFSKGERTKRKIGEQNRDKYRREMQCTDGNHDQDEDCVRDREATCPDTSDNRFKRR